MRQHNRGRGIPRGGGRGGRVGRPRSPVLEQRPPGSPIVNTLSVQQGVPSSNDNILDTFLEVLTLNLILAFHCITVVLTHVKNVGCGFISKLKKKLLKVSHTKYTSRNHNIHRHRLPRAVPIILLIIISNVMALATVNINLHEPNSDNRTTLFPTNVESQYADLIYNIRSETDYIIKIIIKLPSLSYSNHPLYTRQSFIIPNNITFTP